MTLFQAALLLAALLCALVAGFLFAFAAVVMPGLARLDDAAFIRSFQSMDRIIQDRQPLFLVVWAGSVVAVVTAAVLSVWAVAGVDRALVLGAALVYVAGVQVPTGLINIPLNNRIQSLDVAAATAAERHDTRTAFEARWNRWNAFRTGMATLTTALLLVVLFRA